VFMCPSYIVAHMCYLYHSFPQYVLAVSANMGQVSLVFKNY